MRWSAPPPAASAAVLPYFGYAPLAGPQIGAAHADLGQARRQPRHRRAGANRVVSVDLHIAQIQGFFDMPTGNLCRPARHGCDIPRQIRRNGNLVVVSPDVGGVVRAPVVRPAPRGRLAIVDKRRERAGVSRW